MSIDLSAETVVLQSSSALPEAVTTSFDPVETSFIDRLVREPDGPLTAYAGIPDEESIAESPETAKYKCFATSDPVLIHEARLLVAQRYLHLNFVSADQIDRDGTLTQEADPYASHSTYYVVLDRASNQMVATSRRIHYDPARGEASFPVWEHKAELNPNYVSQVEQIGLDKCVEISALVRNPAFKPDRRITMELYRQMFQDVWRAGDAGEKIFLMACKPSLYKTFRKIFDGSIERMGEDLNYPGEIAVPALFRTTEGSASLINKAGESVFKNRHNWIHRRVVKYMMVGADVEKFDPSIINALQNGPFEKTLDNLGVERPPTPTFAERLKNHKPEIGVGAFLIGWTALRTLGVVEGVSPDTDVDWRVFLGIEVATTPSYIIGVRDTVRSILHPEQYSRRQKVKALLMGGGSFLAPYAYVTAEGHDMPSGAWAGVGAFAAASVALFLSKVRKGRKANPDTNTQ